MYPLEIDKPSILLVKFLIELSFVKLFYSSDTKGMLNTCESMNSNTGTGFCEENYRDQKVLNNSTIYSTFSEQQWDEEKTELVSATSSTPKNIKGNFPFFVYFRLLPFFFFVLLRFSFTNLI